MLSFNKYFENIVDNHAGRIILIALILILGLVFGKLLRRVLKRFFDNSSVVLRSNPTHFNFLLNAVPVIVSMLAVFFAIYMMPGGESLAVSLFASAGVFAAILGFASQAAFANIISGLFLVIFKPFRVNDVLKIGDDKSGVVEDITLRHTIILNFENKRIIIPNSIIGNEILINSTIRDERILKHVEFNISYNSDIDLAKRIIAEEAINHPNFLDNRSKEEVAANYPAVSVRVIELGEYAVKLRAWVWTENPDKAFILHTDLNETIKKRFDAEGIVFPFPSRMVYLENKDERGKKKEE